MTLDLPLGDYVRAHWAAQLMSVYRFRGWECVTETQKDIAASFLVAPILGHVGDGNFHLIIMFNPNDPKEVAEVERLNERLIHRALALDGTCTGEHGIGSREIDSLVAEHGGAIDAMRAIKKAIDPDNIMNPGKILRI